MTSKRSKERVQEADTPASRHTSIGDPLPGQLEKEFRLLLGRNNYHFNLLEVAAHTFADTLAKQSDEAAYIRDRAKKIIGQHSLHPHSSFASARTYMIYSHISYVFSAGDVICKRIRSTARMKALKNESTFLDKINKGDFVKKTLALAVLGILPPEHRDAETVNAKVEQVQKLESFALVNYFRIVRNEELHAKGESGQRVLEMREALFEVRARCGEMPSSADQLSARDALLCSKAWQDVAKWLCRHMLNETEARAILKSRFGRLHAERRQVAARKFMQLELLYSQDDITAMLSAINW